MYLKSYRIRGMMLLHCVTQTQWRKNNNIEYQRIMNIKYQLIFQHEFFRFDIYILMFYASSFSAGSFIK